LLEKRDEGSCEILMSSLFEKFPLAIIRLFEIDASK